MGILNYGINGLVQVVLSLLFSSPHAHLRGISPIMFNQTPAECTISWSLQLQSANVKMSKRMPMVYLSPHCVHAPLSATGTACALVVMLLSSPLTLSAPSFFPGTAYLPLYHCAPDCHPTTRWPLQCQQDKCNAARMCVYLGSVCVLCAGCECCACACCVCVC